MSNIDFDLLEGIDTSPIQPPNSNERNSPIKGGSNILNKIDQTELDYTGSAELSKIKVGTTPDDNINNERSKESLLADQTHSTLKACTSFTNPSSDTASSLTIVQELLSRQSEKLRLTNSLNELIVKRKYLKESIEDMAEKIKFIKNSQRKLDIHTKIDQLIEDSNKDYIDLQNKNEESTQVIPSEHYDNDEDYISKNLNVLPSNNWNERLNLIKHFYPYLDIEAVKTYNNHHNHENLLRNISFTISCPFIFRLLMIVKVNPTSDSIIEVLLDNDQLTTIRLISPSYHQVLTNNYIRTKKLDLILYSLNSLSILVHKKITILYSLIQKFIDFIDDPKFENIVNSKEPTNNFKVFSLLRSLDSLTLVIDKNQDRYHVRIHWNILLNDFVLGKCETKLNLAIIRQSDLKPLNDVDYLFGGLVKDYGIIDGLVTLLNTTFGINIE